VDTGHQPGKLRIREKVMARKKKKDLAPACARCAVEPEMRACKKTKGVGSQGCPTLICTEVLAGANEEYLQPETGGFAQQASIQEAECYANRHERPYVTQPVKTRIVEICEFARRMQYKRLGLIFCNGLKKEAAIVDEVLKNNGFEVVSVICKAGRTSKDFIGIEDADKVFQGTDEVMCNPIFQAMIANAEGTDFNILLGLCVGHDSLFFKYAKAYTTVLAVKDRVTGHNPMAAIYLYDHYYNKLKKPFAARKEEPHQDQEKAEKDTEGKKPIKVSRSKYKNR
jgi:uncharacterized metal-binding protein